MLRWFASTLFFVAACKFSGNSLGDGDAGGDGGATADGTLVIDAGPPSKCRLALGSDHTCVHVVADGSVHCFGADSWGELANGAAGTTHVESKVATIPAIRAAANRFFHTCALVAADGSVWCWGQNDRGQLGNGSADLNPHDPTMVGNLAGVVELATARTFNCARRASDVTCWGNNDAGQLGDGMTQSRYTPSTAVSLSAQPVELSLGASNACARMTDGSAVCWGSNTFGQLGASAADPQRTPIAAPLAGSFVQIVINGYSTGSANGGQSCAIVEDGSAWCWGSNEFGQLGNGVASAPNPTPSRVMLNGVVVELAMGRYHVCARHDNGGVSCWGGNDFGQLGAAGASSGQPRSIALPGPAVQLAAGGWHTCAVLDTGALYCWGKNGAGQLGTPAATSAGPSPSHPLCE